MNETGSRTPTSDADTPLPGVSALAKATLIVGLVSFGVGQSLLFVVFNPMALTLGISPIEVGFIFSITGLAVMFTAPRWGLQSDQWGRKTVFLIGLLGYALGTAALAVVLNVAEYGYLSGPLLFVVLVLSRILYGCLASAIQPATTAYISDLSDERTRARDIALVSLGSTVGIVVGPTVGGLLSRFDLTFPFYASAAFGFLAAGFAYLFLDEPPQHRRRQARPKLRITDPRVLPYLVFGLCLFMVFVSVQVITVFYLAAKFGFEDADLAGIASIALVSLALSSIFVQAVVVQLLKVPAHYLLRASFALFGAGLLLLALAPNLLLVFFAYSLMGLGLGSANPGITASATLSVERHEYGAVAGLLTAAPVTGIVIGPIYGALLYDVAPNLPMLVGAAIMIGLAIGAFLVKAPTARGQSVAPGP